MMGVMDDIRRAGQISAELLNANAPLHIPGLAVLISAGRRVAAVWKPAALWACLGIAIRTIGRLRIYWCGKLSEIRWRGLA